MRVVKNPRRIEYKRHHETAKTAARVASETGRYVAVNTPVAKSVRATPADAQNLLKHGLASSLSGISDLFRSWDEDGNGVVSKEEFRRAINGLGLFAKLISFGHSSQAAEAACDAVFDEYDADSSGAIRYEEFVRYSLRDALRQSFTRIIDLFRRWDEDRSGSIDAKEFRRAIAAVGLSAPKEAIDEIFAQMDVDGSGFVEYRELNRVLRSEEVKLTTVMYPGGAGHIEMESKNLHGLNGKAGRTTLATAARPGPSPPRERQQAVSPPPPPSPPPPALRATATPSPARSGHAHLSGVGDVSVPEVAEHVPVARRIMSSARSSSAPRDRPAPPPHETVLAGYKPAWDTTPPAPLPLNVMGRPGVWDTLLRDDDDLEIEMMTAAVRDQPCNSTPAMLQRDLPPVMHKLRKHRLRLRKALLLVEQASSP